jgi:hypothetical protein
MLPQSESTLKHQMWSWSPEGVGPAENSWQAEVHLSVLQRCGDGVKPGKEQIPLASDPDKHRAENGCRGRAGTRSPVVLQAVH